MGNYKLLVADIDGTLVDHGSDGSEIHVDHPAKLAIDKATKNGKLFTIATGRNFLWAKTVIDAFNITTPVIVNSGSRIVDPTDQKVLWEKRLEMQKGHLIYDFIASNIADTDFNVGLGYLEEVAFKDIEQKAIDELIYLDLIGLKSSEDIDSITNFVQKLDGVSWAVLPSPQSPGNQNVIITNSKGTKYNALRELQNILKLDQAETIAVGDGNNDLPLFEASGLKVAVDNASPGLKDAADVVVSSVDEYGIVETIERFLIPQN